MGAWEWGLFFFPELFFVAKFYRKNEIDMKGNKIKWSDPAVFKEIFLIEFEENNWFFMSKNYLLKHIFLDLENQ